MYYLYTVYIYVIHGFIGGNPNAKGYQGEILQPAAIPFLHNLGPISILRDDNARPHRAETTSGICKQREWNGLPTGPTSTQLNTCGIGLGVLFMLQWPTQPCWLTSGMERHPAAVCDRAGYWHEDELPGCCGCVWFCQWLLLNKLQNVSCFRFNSIIQSI